MKRWWKRRKPHHEAWTLANVIQEVWTPDRVSQDAGWPCRLLVMPDSPKAFPFTVGIGPRNPLDVTEGPAFTWVELGSGVGREREPGQEINNLMNELVARWRQDCLPHMKAAA